MPRFNQMTAVAFSDILGFGHGFGDCGLDLEGHGLGGCGLANITAAAAAVAALLLILLNIYEPGLFL